MFITTRQLNEYASICKIRKQFSLAKEINKLVKKLASKKQLGIEYADETPEDKLLCKMILSSGEDLRTLQSESQKRL